MASAIGLDIGTSAVRAVQLSGSSPPALDVVGQVMLPPGAVRNGELSDPTAVTQAIVTLFKEHKFRGKKVVLGVANQQVVVRQVELQAMDLEDLRASLPLQVQDYIPIPANEAQLDFKVLSEFEGPNGQPMLRILLVAAATEMVNQVLDVVKSAKLRPVGVALDAFALLESIGQLGGPGHDPSVGEMLINIGADVTSIVMHAGGAPHFVRIMMMGGNDVSEAIVNASGMPLHEAERLKVQGALPPGDVANVAEERRERLIAEIRGSFDYYRSQKHSLHIQRAIVTGGGSLLQGLGPGLGDALGIPTAPGHALQHVKLGKVSVSPEELAGIEPLLSVAIGLALGELR